MNRKACALLTPPSPSLWVTELLDCNWGNGGKKDVLHTISFAKCHEKDGGGGWLAVSLLSLLSEYVNK